MTIKHLEPMDRRAAPGSDGDLDAVNNPPDDIVGTPSEKYHHSPLDEVLREIRLFRIVRACSTHVQIHLEHFPLDDAPQYRAVSYCWGSQTSKKSIAIGSAVLEVGDNLYDLLRVNAKRLMSTYLWADQICINQSVLKERNHQVQLMEEIYRKAERVIVWLGVTESSEAAMKTLKTLPRTEDLFSEFGRMRCDPSLDSSWSIPLEQLVQNSYWGRHWVVQEVHLAQRRSLLYGSRVFSQHMIAALLVFNTKRLVGFNLALENLLSKFEVPESRVSRELKWPVAMDLCKHTSCEDPRDKVYGIQSLLPKELRTDVDYNKTTRQVFDAAAFAAFLFVHPQALYAGLVALALGMQLPFKPVMPGQNRMHTFVSLLIRLEKKVYSISSYCSVYRPDMSDTGREFIARSVRAEYKRRTEFEDVVSLLVGS